MCFLQCILMKTSMAHFIHACLICCSVAIVTPFFISLLTQIGLKLLCSHITSCSNPPSCLYLPTILSYIKKLVFHQAAFLSPGILSTPEIIHSLHSNIPLLFTLISLLNQSLPPLTPAFSLRRPSECEFCGCIPSLVRQRLRRNIHHK